MQKDINKRKIAKRCTIDLTKATVEILEQIRGTFEITTADVFRGALMLMKIYTDAVSTGRKIAIIDPDNPDMSETISLLAIPKSQSGKSQSIEINNKETKISKEEVK